MDHESRLEAIVADQRTKLERQARRIAQLEQLCRDKDEIINGLGADIELRPEPEPHRRECCAGLTG